jgi:hypothetical protein
VIVRMDGNESEQICHDRLHGVEEDAHTAESCEQLLNDVNRRSLFRVTMISLSPGGKMEQMANQNH